jgi:dihydrofolate synthase / folylpolyglutamate synthase
MMTYPDSVRFLYALGNEVKTAKLGLERMRTLVEALGDPHRSCRFVHVAGTNGKGSTAAMIEAGLRASGFRTGLYTSPHLAEPTERIRIGGVPVTAEAFAGAFHRVHETAEKLLSEGRLDFHPTYFESVTAMAFLLFRDAGVETAVLEVGLGGRLDATNVVLPALAVITPVDFDHEVYLGRSLESIATEKAGILKPGVPAVFAPQRDEVQRTLEEAATCVGAPFETTAQWRVEHLDADAYGSSFVACGPRRVEVACPLAGEHQITNAITAVAALHALGVPTEAIETGIRETRWPGRLECIAHQPDVFLDGAHNPAGARALARYITRFWRERRVRIIYGAMRDKAVAEMAGILFPLAWDLILTAPHQARAVRPEVIREMTDHPRVRVAAELRDALALIPETGPEDVIFITGSLYLVGEARALLVE